MSTHSDDHDGYYCPPVPKVPTTTASVASKSDQNEDSGKSNGPWFFSSLMSTLKARRLDIHCNIDEKLKQLQSPDGSLEHIWKVGKHRLLSQAGSLEESRDRDYERKIRAATMSKSLLQQIEGELEQVVKTTSQMMGHFDALLDLLEKFRDVCDDAQREPSEGRDHTSHSGSSTTIGEDAIDNDGDYIHGSTAGRRHITHEDIKLMNIRKSLHDVTDVFNYAVKSSCMSISSMARSELNNTQCATIGKVMNAKCDFDLLRHKIMKGGDVPGNKRSDGVAYPYNISSEEPGFSQVGVGESSFILVNSPSSYRSPSQPSMASSIPPSTRKALVEASESYTTEISTAKEQLNFILEQTAMSTMSCYNVFFSQMAGYFQSVYEGSSDISKVLVRLKNSQDIARKLTKERRDKMMRNAAREVSDTSGDSNNSDNLSENLSATTAHKTSTSVHPSPLGEIITTSHITQTGDCVSTLRNPTAVAGGDSSHNREFDSNISSSSSPYTDDGDLGILDILFS